VTCSDPDDAKKTTDGASSSGCDERNGTDQTPNRAHGRSTESPMPWASPRPCWSKAMARRCRRRGVRPAWPRRPRYCRRSSASRTRRCAKAFSPVRATLRHGR